MRFDWYQATIPECDDDEVAPLLAASLSARVLRTKARLGYGRGYSVQRGDEVLATVLEGSARPGEVHVIITGGSCDEVVPTLRAVWPAHRVSRADSALDFRGDFDVLDRFVARLAHDRGLKSTLIVNSDGGATRYVGSPKSELRCRVYKKSEQLLSLHPERADEIPAGIVRAELVARPSKRETKEAAASLDPVALWGLGEWSQGFAREFLGVEAVRAPTHFRRPSDWTRAMHWLEKQYGPVVARRLETEPAAEVVRDVLAALGLDAGHALDNGAGQGAA